MVSFAITAICDVMDLFNLYHATSSGDHLLCVLLLSRLT